MGSMGTRGFHSRRTWSRLLVVLLAVLVSTPMTMGQSDGEDEGADIDRPKAPNPIPILSLSLFPTQLQAKVTQSQLGTVTFRGNATVEQMMFMDSTVTLQARVNAGWPVQINPTTIQFQGSGTESFTVTVIVPPGTSSLVTGNVIVTGSCKVSGLSPIVASCQGVVTVSQYYKIRVESSDPDATVSSGETAEYELALFNDGNGQTTFRVTVMDTPKDIKIELSNDEFTVQREEFSVVTVRVTPGSRAASGEHDIRIQIEDLESLQDDPKVIVFNVTAVVPSMADEVGYPVIIGLVVLGGTGVAVVVLWKKDKLKGLKQIKRPKRLETK